MTQVILNLTHHVFSIKKVFKEVTHVKSISGTMCFAPNIVCSSFLT